MGETEHVSSMKYRKATRYQDLAKARAEVARLFPLALGVIEGILRHKNAPRALRLECAKLVFYQHVGRPPGSVEIAFEGEMTNLSQGDRIARAAAEARKAFQQSLEKANGLSGLDEFATPSDSSPGGPEAAGNAEGV